MSGYNAINNSGEDIPAFSVAEVSGVSDSGGYELYSLIKPSEDNLPAGKLMFTGAAKIPAGKRGMVYSPFDKTCACNGSADDDGYCGAAIDSFSLSASNTGFISQGANGGKVFIRPFGSGSTINRYGVYDYFNHTADIGDYGYETDKFQIYKYGTDEETSIPRQGMPTGVLTKNRIFYVESNSEIDCGGISRIDVSVNIYGDDDALLTSEYLYRFSGLYGAVKNLTIRTGDDFACVLRSMPRDSQPIRKISYTFDNLNGHTGQNITVRGQDSGVKNDIGYMVISSTNWT